MELVNREQRPGWVRVIDNLNTYLSQNVFGGRKSITMAWVINLHKFLSLFIVASLMVLFSNYSLAVWVYLALHGTYGFCWLLKHFAFRDPKWEVKVTFGGAVFTFLLLATYWVAPYLLISGMLQPNQPAPSNWLLALCIALHTFGVVIMTSADCQKQFSLNSQRVLITTGMFARVRHPNYLGEMMVYASYALIVQHWIPWIILAYWWTMVFLVNMLTIESSLSRYPEWQNYKARTSMLIPGLL
jgi:protein-S-isoprenylcysteine O-methyltransferase Ste14